MKERKVEVGQRWVQTRKDGSLRHVVVVDVFQEGTVGVGYRWRVTLRDSVETTRPSWDIWEKSLLRGYERTYRQEKALGSAKAALRDLPMPRATPTPRDAAGQDLYGPDVSKMEAMREQLLEADAAQPDDAPPLEAQLNKAALPKAVRLMVEYCEKAPVEEILWAMERQFQTSVDTSSKERMEEARHKLTGLVVGVALGVAILPAEPLFPALVSADRLARLVKVQRKTLHRKKAKEKTRLRKLRKERKAKRRASKRTR
ncbi:MAG: hypothetical protein KAT70_08070 [Thermoplasmata archaeon]|nr:hypothetical protein [Thermoplasmata archaeon]